MLEIALTVCNVMNGGADESITERMEGAKASRNTENESGNAVDEDGEENGALKKAFG